MTIAVISLAIAVLILAWRLFKVENELDAIGNLLVNTIASDEASRAQVGEAMREALLSIDPEWYPFDQFMEDG